MQYSDEIFYSYTNTLTHEFQNKYRCYLNSKKTVLIDGYYYEK